ncbi:MAG: hypothetical protein ACYCOU_11595 [Sulfobacillus sp.]
MRWNIVLGLLLAVTLPIALALAVPQYMAAIPAIVAYPAIFGATTLVGQLGLWVKRMDNPQAASWLLGDLLIAAISGLAAYGATHLAIVRGGGSTDPALLAVLCAYFLMAWPRSSRIR